MQLAVTSTRQPRSRAYQPPASPRTTTLGELLPSVRPIPGPQQRFFGFDEGHPHGRSLWIAGDPSLVQLPGVAIVGTRKVTPDGAARARRLARELAEVGVVVVSGLAAGVDTEALTAAMEAGGKTIAVIGTPLEKAYPAANKRLQEEIYRSHLLVSQFAPGTHVFPSNFPARNRTMAAISDATVIVEASDGSGTLHQAAECTRLGRHLFIARSVAEDPKLSWPAKFVGYPTTHILDDTDQVLNAIEESRGCR